MAARMPLPTALVLIDAAAARLSGFEAPAFDAEFLFRGVAGLTRAELLARGDQVVSSEVMERYEAAVTRRVLHEPMQYILGTAFFWRDEFVVNRAVLIPRPETEILVEAVVARLSDIPEARILDIGTGSGCIALSVLRDLPRASAVALDLSTEALAVATENAQRLGLSGRIEFRESRWLDSLTGDESFDAVLSNPPYVATTDERSLPVDVRDFEPGLALFADASDDISSYRAILDGLAGHLRTGGLLAVEVGLGQAGRVARLLQDHHFEAVETLNDLASIPRVVLGRRP